MVELYNSLGSASPLSHNLSQDNDVRMSCNYNRPVASISATLSPYSKHPALPSIKELSLPDKSSFKPMRRGSISDHLLQSPINKCNSSPISPKFLDGNFQKNLQVGVIPYSTIPFISAPTYFDKKDNSLSTPHRQGRQNRSMSVTEVNFMKDFDYRQQTLLRAQNSPVYPSQFPSLFGPSSSISRDRRASIQMPNMISSLGEDRFVCEECHASFSRKNSLKRHMFTHSSKRPYACKACDKSFYRADIYNRHLKSKRCRRSREIPALVVGSNDLFQPITIFEE